MKLLRLKLNNIGPYIGNNEFDFSVSDDKNILLIGGKNGAGKTSLLQAIRVSLFGPLSFGLKNESNSYFSSLQRLLNYKELEKDASYFSTSISFLLDEEYISNEYQISRKWIKKSKKSILHESVDIVKNNKKLEELEKEILIVKLKEIFPPSLIELSLFDGEKIGKIIDENRTSEFIKEVFCANFGINYFEYLKSDLSSYLNSAERTKLLSNEELDLLEIENKVIALKKENSSNAILKKNYEIRSKEIQLRYREKIKRFNNMGGVTKARKEEIMDYIKNHEDSQKERYQEIKSFLEDDIVFYMNENLISQIVHQIKDEKPLKYAKYLEEISEWLGDTDIVTTLKDKIVSNLGSDKYYLDASEEDEKSIMMLFEGISSSRIEDSIVRKIEKYTTEVTKSKDYRNILRKNEKDDELSSLLNEIIIEGQEIKSLLQKIQEIEDNQEERQLQIEQLKIRVEILEKTIRQSSNEQNSFVTTQKINKVISNFRELFIQKKLTEIALACKDRFLLMSEKVNYITSIHISKDFEIEIIDKKNRAMPMEILSAGEKQLLVSSLIYAIVKVSNREIPFIFDTPLARLDLENRQNFVRNIMSDISKQIIILSTDSEIVGTLKNAIDDRIAGKYTLKYGDNDRTSIIRGYFDEEVERNG